MKKFVIGYIFISVLFAAALYYITLTLGFNQRVYDVFQNHSNEALETKDFDDFIAYQSIMYQLVNRRETNDYFIGNVSYYWE